MNQALCVLQQAKPTRVIRDVEVYDGIVWAGMLSGEHIAFVGNEKLFGKLRGEARSLCLKWVHELGLDEVDLAPDLVLKTNVQYAQRD